MVPTTQIAVYYDFSSDTFTYTSVISRKKQLITDKQHYNPLAQNAYLHNPYFIT